MTWSDFAREAKAAGSQQRETGSERQGGAEQTRHSGSSRATHTQFVGARYAPYFSLTADTRLSRALGCWASGVSLFRINVRLSGRQKCHSVRLPWYQMMT